MARRRSHPAHRAAGCKCQGSPIPRLPPQVYPYTPLYVIRTHRATLRCKPCAARADFWERNAILPFLMHEEVI